jgi:hypothetical protein
MGVREAFVGCGTSKNEKNIKRGGGWEGGKDGDKYVYLNEVNS